MSQGVWLAIHTTDTPGALAVVSDNDERARPLDAEGRHASTLLGAIEALFADLHQDVTELSGVVLTRGPGSFTGIRIGMATAQGLAQALGVPVASCDSLWAEAAAHANNGLLATVLDARRGEVYAGLYRLGEAGPRPICAPFVDAPEAASRRLLDAAGAADAQASLLVSGSGALLVPFEADVARHVTRIERVPRTDVARALARAAQAHRLPRQTPRDLEPLYLRKSDAELNRQARLGQN
jgi:tRNA threonylcarbamoyladenosine biosynthesis protein TsaB